MAKHDSERAALQQRLTDLRNRYKSIVQSHESGDIEKALARAAAIAADASSLRSDVISAYGPNLLLRTASLEAADAVLARKSSEETDAAVAAFVDLGRALNALQRELRFQEAPLFPRARLRQVCDFLRQALIRGATDRRYRSARLVFLTFVGLVILLQLGAAILTMGHGLRATYFKDMNLRHEAATRVDRAINFNWENGSPMEGIPNDKFSVRWEGSLWVDKEGDYEFALGSDDGTRLWIDNTRVIDNWRPQSFTTEYGTAVLTRGEHIIRVEYFEHSNTAQVILSWREVGPNDFEVISTRRLKPKKSSNS